MKNEKARQAVVIHLKKSYFYLFVPVFFILGMRLYTMANPSPSLMLMAIFAAVFGSLPLLVVNFTVVLEAMAEVTCRKCIFKATLFLQILSILVIALVGRIFINFIT